jgi:hypothetical protein
MYRPSLRHMRSIHGQLLVTCCDVMWHCARATSVMCLLTANRIGLFEAHKCCDLHRKQSYNFVSQVLNVCSRSSGIVPPSLTLSVQCRLIFSLTLLPFYTQRHRAGGQLDREAGRTFWRREKYPFGAEDRLPICPATWISNKCKNYNKFAVCVSVDIGKIYV